MQDQDDAFNTACEVVMNIVKPKKSQEKVEEKVIKKLEKKKNSKTMIIEGKAELREVEKEAEKAVKKTQKKAEEAIKKVVAEQEVAPGGIVDIITETLANHAKANKDKSGNRARVETSISNKVSAFDSAISVSKSALTKGLKSTQEQSDQANGAAKKEIREIVSAPVRDRDISTEELTADLRAAAEAPMINLSQKKKN